MSYTSICKVERQLPAWWERKILYQTMPLTLRDKKTGALSQGRFHWGFLSASHFEHLQQLSHMIEENPRLTTTWKYEDGGEDRGGSTYFTLSFDDQEIVSCDFRYDANEFGCDLENIIAYVSNILQDGKKL